MSEPASNARTQAKANRRAILLTSAATLFAQRGFNGVSIEDLGAAAGVSGPAVYRHFSSKQALLGALLVGVSEDLLLGGREVLERNLDAGTALRELVSFHVDFALGKPDVIRVQDRDLDALSPADLRQVRLLQRGYVELWVEVLGTLFPARDAVLRRLQAHAIFGLINSTPHSVHLQGGRFGAVAARPTLEAMAWAGLTGV
ncbi:TetR/AcrR family transcriptional regulator [Arthrobacter sp. GMC3]|uniref:TetR/AcrR family transcriptional regulator n=1 Tax=Arthrobacter sp. GMC3 TaxID=2058894 RepID=UPI000CE4BF0B|nr:TetR/AcrR family transcriptional regulator [Arthrobacter sp. GMC3]